MNKNMLVVLVVVFVLIGGVVFVATRQQTTTTPDMSIPSASAQSAVSSQSVDIKNFAFAPASITVKKGDSVTFTNSDSAPHSATADGGSFDTGVMQQGGTKAVAFLTAGTFTYHCSVHPNMKATVVVTN